MAMTLPVREISPVIARSGIGALFNARDNKQVTIVIPAEGLSNQLKPVNQ
jgi:hypothetical protein